MNAPKTQVAAVIATYRRPQLLAALLESLAAQGEAFAGAIVIDNGNDPAIKAIVEAAPIRTTYIAPGTNLGCGGGVRLALTEGLKNPAYTHFWILDDDCWACPQTLSGILAGMAQLGADLGTPMIINADGLIINFPGLLEKRKWRVIKKPGLSSEEYLAQCGPDPELFFWCPWPSLVVSRHALELVGVPRADYWYQGEDIEFVMRITYRLKAAFIPTVQTKHLPPGIPDQQKNRRDSYLKNCMSVQNSIFTFLRLPHGWRGARYVPGHFWRLFRDYGFSLETFTHALRAFYLGALLGKTTGMPGGSYFKELWLANLEHR